jgi:hypothetical protein
MVTWRLRPDPLNAVTVDMAPSDDGTPDTVLN